MTKEEIIDYVLNSPENTNPNVLKGMLDQLDSGASPSGELIKYNTVTIKNVSDEAISFGALYIVDQGVIIKETQAPIIIPSKTDVIINFITVDNEGTFLSILYFVCDEGFVIEVSDLSGWEKESESTNKTRLIYFSEDTPLVDQNLVVTVNVQGSPK